MGRSPNLPRCDSGPTQTFLPTLLHTSLSISFLEIARVVAGRRPIPKPALREGKDEFLQKQDLFQNNWP